jgi:type IV pilus assembly protein PilM
LREDGNMLKRRFRSNTYLGVDIGSAAIKAVELNPGDKTMSVRAVGAVATPPDAMQEGRITNPHAIGRALRKMLSNAGIRTRQAVTAVSGQVAIVREVRMPNLPAAELKQAARFEVERYLPYPIAEVTYDVGVIGEVKEEGNTRLDVLVVAARSDVLNQHVAALRAAGLEPIVVDMEPFALARAMVGGNGSGQHLVIYIHVGAANTAIVIVDGTTPRVMRNVAFGGNTFTRLLAERLGVDFDKAEAVKLHLGTGSKDGASKLDPQQLEEVLMTGLRDLTTEVRRSLEYYGGRYMGAVPERAVVTGGGALLPGLTKYLSIELDVPVEVGDPFEGLAKSQKFTGAELASQSGAMLAVAVGLAQREAEGP